MVNYACAFSQSESGKYFEWIIRVFNHHFNVTLNFLKFFLLLFSQTCEFWSSKANWRLRFSLPSIILTDLLENKTNCFPRELTLSVYYHSFKIFPRFWLANSARIFHHNQLLMTKFRRILRLINQWRESATFFQVNAPLAEKTWGRGWVILVVKTKMADISLVSRDR